MSAKADRRPVVRRKQRDGTLEQPDGCADPLPCKLDPLLEKAFRRNGTERNVIQYMTLNGRKVRRTDW